MRAILLSVVLYLSVAPAFAQSGPPGGGGGPPGGGPPGGGPPGGGIGGPPQPPAPPKPIKRTQIDKPVAAMFALADRNRDGMVTLDELRLVVVERREERIRARFERIDTDRNRAVSEAEFLAWQRSLGSIASSENQSIADMSGPVPEAILPDVDDGFKGTVLLRVIEPLSALTIVNANTNYDAGMSLDEMLIYQRSRFDRADADHDGELAIYELRNLDPEGPRPGGGGAGFPDRPRGLPPG